VIILLPVPLAWLPPSLLREHPRADCTIVKCELVVLPIFLPSSFTLVMISSDDNFSIIPSADLPPGKRLLHASSAAAQSFKNQSLKTISKNNLSTVVQIPLDQSICTVC